MQSELREGVLHRGEDHAGAEVAPEAGPAEGDPELFVSGYIIEYGQLEVSQGLQEVLECG